MLGVEVPPEQQAMVGYGTFEGALEANTHIAGEAFSAADVYVGTNLNWGVKMTQTIAARPAFTRYLDLLVERPAFTRASGLDDALAATLA